MSNTWVGDLEGDGFLDNVTKIHCLVLRNFGVDSTGRDASSKICFVPSTHVALVKKLGEYKEVHKVKSFPSWVNKERPRLVFHFGEGYDFPAMKKVWSWEPREEDRIDSLILARMDDPARDNSIEGWGRYFGVKKPEHEDWSKFSLDMLHRCDEDTYIGWRLFRHLLANTLVPKCSKRSRQVELDMQRELHQVKWNGIYLRREIATKLMRETKEKADEIADELKRIFKPLGVPLLEVQVRVTKAGGLHKRSEEAIRNSNTKFQVHREPIERKFTKIDWKEFNPGSPKDRIRELQKLGWKHTQTTPAGNPKFTEDSVVEALHKDEPWYRPAKLLLDWLYLDHRSRTARDWLEAADDEGYVHHTIHALKARTTRGSHTNPPTGNISKYSVEKIKANSKKDLLKEIKARGFDSKKDYIRKEIKQKSNPSDRNKRIWVCEVPVLGLNGKYGWECRDSFGIKDTENNILVGVDAASMQLRALAHYSNDEDYIRRILEEDPHMVHAEGLGLLDNPNGRAISKTFIYAWLLGAGLLKQGIIISEEKVSDKAKLLSIGKEANENFKERFPFIEEIQKKCRKDYNRGYVKGVDGRLVNIDYLRRMKQPHKVLSVYLQEFEASVMKHAAVSKEKLKGEPVGWVYRLRQLEIPSKWRHWVHDEYQVETRKEYGDEVRKIVCESLTRAGELLHTKCRIDGDGKLGLAWSETH